ncbi:hypothetical protein PI124_g10803 [Phytophthora idaei]|nr:hypothetical protein PI125_g22291 [Phytophthora idaei]KAG3126729.1 hypothetical protein PI126_g22201 [Phytophthora idaei]KAG3244413.1 hypothetical protein PI124_g10803 [Phytophthora idaei]
MALKGITRTEKLTDLKSNVSKLKVCGYVGSVCVPKEIRKNHLSVKAEPALFLGFPKPKHGYRLLHLRTGKILEARDVKFREDVTVERRYLNALLKGRQHYYPQIPFIPLPVEYVVEQTVRANASEAVQNAVNEVISGTDLHRVETATDRQMRTAEPTDAAGDEQVTRDTKDDEAVSVGAEDSPIGEASGQDDAYVSPMPTADKLRPFCEHYKLSQTRPNSQSWHNSKRLRGWRRSERKRQTNVRLRDNILASLEMLEYLAGNEPSVEGALASPQGEHWSRAMKPEMKDTK